MKKFIFILFFIGSLFFPVLKVSAHLPGQPPFFKINGILSGYYTVPSTSLVDFNLPQDIGPENYLVSQKIDFEIDTTQLPIPKEVVEKTKFSWNFGDNTKAEGLKNSHSYAKPGSYILTIHAQVEGDFIPPQLLQSILVNVLPSKDYKLPKSIISVDGWSSKDPLIDILEAKFNKEFKFDGSKSESSTKIVEYIWDFGDGTNASGAKVSHKYTTNPYTVFPLLRIKTEDEFIADSFVQIKDNEGSYKEGSSSNQGLGFNIIYFILGGIAILIVFIVFKKLKK